jgi:competence protein ComEA
MHDPDRRVTAAIADWLDASPAELVGLAVLLAGAAVLTGIIWWTGAPRHGDALPVMTPVVSDEPDRHIVVHVAGAVHAPRVVHLPEGSRVVDALAAAGGLRVDAATDGLNLARVLADGEQVYVPTVGEADAVAPGAGGSGGSAWRPDGRLDLNRATAADLEQLPGIGPVLAARIIDWREQNGPFTSVGQLREVSGIGERTLQRLAELVTV